MGSANCREEAAFDLKGVGCQPPRPGQSIPSSVSWVSGCMGFSTFDLHIEWLSM